MNDIIYFISLFYRANLSKNFKGAEDHYNLDYYTICQSYYIMYNYYRICHLKYSILTII